MKSALARSLAVALPVALAGLLWQKPSLVTWLAFSAANAWHPAATETLLDAVWSLHEQRRLPQAKQEAQQVLTYPAASFLNGSSFMWEELLAEVLNRDEPILVKGVLQAVGSGALTWDLEAMASVLTRNVTLRSLVPDARPGEPAMRFQQLPFGEAVRRVEKAEGQVYDLQTLMEEPTLQHQLQLSSSFTRGMGVLVAAAAGWKTEMHAHLDLTTNIILHGRKRWFLVHRSHSLLLRPFFTSPKLQGISAQAQPWATGRHPSAEKLLPRLPRWEVETAQGDALLFPPWTFHALENLPSSEHPDVNLALIFSTTGAHSATTHPAWMAIWVQNLLRMLGVRKLWQAAGIYWGETDPLAKKRDMLRVMSSPFTSA